MLQHFLAIPCYTQLRASLQLRSTLQLPSLPFSPARNPCQDFLDLLRFLDCVTVVSLRLSFPKRADYHNQSSYKFQEEIWVLINLLFPALLDGKRGRQRKLLMEDICCTWIHPMLNIALDFSRLRMTFWISFICQNFYYRLFHLSITFHLLILLEFVIIASCVTPSVFTGFRSDCRQGGLCYGY